MKKIILADGTIIQNCTDSTTSNEIYALRNTYGEAGAVRDSFTAENSTTITVENENDEIETVGADLILLDGATLTKTDDGFVCQIRTRVKTEVEKMQDQIAELQEVIIEG